MCRGDDDDVVVTDAPPPLPPRIRTRGTSFSSCSVENKREQIPYLLTRSKCQTLISETARGKWVRRDGGKAGQTMGRDATHHGRSVARSRRDTGRRPRLSLRENDARVSLSLSIDRNRGGRATDPTTPTTRILHHLYNIYTESRGGGSFRMCLPDGNGMYMWRGGPAGRARQ